jgi:putative ABC transport system ATP-binding protein
MECVSNPFANNDMTLISINKLQKVFRRGDEEIHAIRAIDLSINQGEFIAITGPSGSGKSTLLYILGLLDKPTSGGYALQGSPVENLSDSERAHLRNKFMGFVFQSFHLLPRATALRNVMMPLVYAATYDTPIPEDEQRRRATEALTVVGLADRLNHRPNELSGGQRQRVAIARAIVNKPRLLFADEPTGNLDSKSGKEILSLFEHLHSDGVTIIMVSHDPSVAERAKRKLILQDGALVEDSCAV